MTDSKFLKVKTTNELIEFLEGIDQNLTNRSLIGIILEITNVPFEYTRILESQDSLGHAKKSLIRFLKSIVPDECAHEVFLKVCLNLFSPVEEQNVSPAEEQNFDELSKFYSTKNEKKNEELPILGKE